MAADASFDSYVRHSLARTFLFWQHGEAALVLVLSYTAPAVVAGVTGGALAPSVDDGLATAIGGSLWLVLLLTVVTPFRMWREQWLARTRAEHEIARLTDATGVRVALGRFLDSGQEALSEIHRASKAHEEAPEQRAQDWVDEAHAYLESALGADYVARFHNAAGLPPGYTTLLPPYAPLESGVRFRMARLTQFIEELARR